MFNRSRQLFTAARRVPGVFTFYAVSCALMVVLVAGCSDGLVAPDAAQVEALSIADGTAAAAPMSARGSWHNWHVHDLAYGAEPYTDAEGLRHEDYSIWPVIWPDYPSDESPVVYCTDGAEKALVGGDGGAKEAAGTCRNELYIIHIRLQASDAPAPAESSGWTALPPFGNGFTFYYRLTPR